MVDFFIESTYTDAKGEIRPCFNVTQKGCEFIVHKMTSQKGTEFTARYVNKFHELDEGNITNSLITALNTIFETMAAISNSQNDITNRLSKLGEQSTRRNRQKRSILVGKQKHLINSILSYPM